MTTKIYWPVHYSQKEITFTYNRYIAANVLDEVDNLGQMKLALTL